jgi:hypothetical protein
MATDLLMLLPDRHPQVFAGEMEIDARPDAQ